jgi:hypothetical protein
VEPLSERVRIDLTSWDGERVPTPPAGAPTIFCQLPPPPALLADARARVVWIPMWDHARSLPAAFWAALPPTLRIVAFSRAVADRARAVGLPILELAFFEDPAGAVPARWDAGRVALYWNRTGLVGPTFLADMCRALDIGELLFRDRLDPGIGRGLGYQLPPRLGATRVTPLATEDQAVYLEALARASVFVAPRAHEGAGLTFLEALARGCAVLAHDAPTMSQYITHGESGLLFRARPPAPATRLKRRLRLAAPTPYTVDHDQPWGELSSHSLAALGTTARAAHVAGHARWMAARDTYARFLTDW